MRIALLAASAATFAIASPAAASEKGWSTASDVAVGTLAAWSLGVPVVTGDGKGAFQAATSIGAGYLVSTGLKEVIRETRPDGSDRKSFPSGHTTGAFAAAASIYERRGAKEGIPAFALATFVGVARVQAKKHYWHDVAAGAAIGTAAGLLLTRPLASRRMAFTPWVGGKGGGATVDFVF